MERHRAIFIAGPTASGKSALAIAVAQSVGGTVINADSMQVYRELRVLTARPAPEEEAVVPHRLYGHVGVAESYSVAAWLADVEVAIAETRARGSVPVIVGGTGLYFMALTRGLSPIPVIPDEIRRRWRQAGQELAATELHKELARRDPVTAGRLRDSDRQRIVRALEVIEATGEPLAHWQEKPGTPMFHSDEFIGLVVDRPRDELYARADQRFDQMIAGGGLEEAETIRSMQLDPELPAARAVGLPPLIAHLEGQMSLEEAANVAQRDTRHYIKRQMTWLRRNMIAWRRINANEMERISGLGITFVD